MDRESPDGRFEILYHTREDESHFFSDIDYEWSVASVETGDEIVSFSGSHNQCRDSESKSGVEHVSFSPKGDAVVAKGFDGEVERVELPVFVRLADHGKAVVLAYRDGRKEKRERKPVIFVTKYGEPFEGLPLVGEPRERPPAAKPAPEKTSGATKKSARKKKSGAKETRKKKGRAGK